MGGGRVDNKVAIVTGAGAGIGRAAAVMLAREGARVAVVDIEDLSTVQQGTDGLITQRPDLPLVMAFADCVPVMLFDPVRSVVGIAHAGWRGLVRGVCQAAIRRMVSTYGCQPMDIRAGIGPAIGVCCYEVGSEVVEEFRDSVGDNQDFYRENSRGSYHLDLEAASQVALRQAGVTQIETASLCTACNVDEFFSHRREAGRTGRFGAIIALRRSSIEGI